MSCSTLSFWVLSCNLQRILDATVDQQGVHILSLKLQWIRVRVKMDPCAHLQFSGALWRQVWQPSTGSGRRSLARIFAVIMSGDHHQPVVIMSRYPFVFTIYKLHLRYVCYRRYSRRMTLKLFAKKHVAILCGNWQVIELNRKKDT